MTRSVQAVTECSPSPGCIAHLTTFVLPKMRTLPSTSKPTLRTPVCRLSNWKCRLDWISASSLVHSAHNQSSATAEVIERCIDDKASAAESTSQHDDRLSSFPISITGKKNYKFFSFCLVHQRSQTQIVSRVNGQFLNLSWSTCQIKNKKVKYIL